MAKDDTVFSLAFMLSDYIKMKLLLLGDYSGLQKYLKEGLQQIGEEVTLYSNGDGWKKIPGADCKLYKNTGNRYTNFLHGNIDPLFILNKFSGYDVVQLINPVIFSLTDNVPLVKEIKRKNKCLSLISAGYDTRLYEKYKQGFFDYYMLDGAQDVLQSYDVHNIKGKLHQWNDHRIEELVDVIIPSSYEYAVGYSSSEKASNVIPFPINIDEILYSPNIVGDRIVIFHGLNREIEKGTSYIRKALTKVAEEYPDEIEVVIEGRMPFDKYLLALQKANIVIDQCKSYGYGMNACISMAMGKVVLSGARQEHLMSLGVTDCPVIHIQPDADQIYKVLKELIENKNLIYEIGKRSREYVERVHNYKMIASKFVETWKKTLEKKGVYKLTGL